MERNGRITFEGGPLNGMAYELPPGTIELRITGYMPGIDVYQLTVGDDGVVARWVGMRPEPEADGHAS